MYSLTLPVNLYVTQLPSELCAAIEHSSLGTVLSIGAKPNLYCKAIELVCGGSPKVCVLVEWKALDRVKSEL